MTGQEQNKPHHPHDKGYKQLLANKRTFLELLKTFVREDWIKDIDESDLVLVNKSYILQDFNEKEADIVYRLRTKGNDVIFYVLLELQSTVDYTMPFRLLLYMTEIWRDVYNNTPKDERERKDFRLPAVIPAVLYNGANRWTASINFKEILSGYRKFEKHILDFSYILFDVNRYSEEKLYRAANLISSVFVLDQRIQAGELIGRLRKLADGLKNLSRDEFRQFVIWLAHVLKARLPEPLQEKVDKIIDEVNPWEVEIMITNLEIALKEMEQQALLKGKKEGLKKGLEKGEKKKALEVAKKLLQAGMDDSFVIEISGLSKEELESVKEEIKKEKH
ncbi:MAG: Rpn family recombination-promoting nuclease/putative transposase [Peptococcaceae bacterium]|nr:Rpn family recombination-promoting nuclease/putative transposase [Peptococcaceae bacterium]